MMVKGEKVLDGKTNVKISIHLIDIKIRHFSTSTVERSVVIYTNYLQSHTKDFKTCSSPVMRQS